MTFVDLHHTVTSVLMITLTDCEDHSHFTAPAPDSGIAELLRGRSGISSYLPFLGDLCQWDQGLRARGQGSTHTVTHDRISFFINPPKYSFICICYISFNVVSREVGSISWPLCTTVQCFWECEHLFTILISIHLDTRSEVEFLEHTVIPFSIFWEITVLFSIEATIFGMQDA